MKQIPKFQQKGKITVNAETPKQSNIWNYRLNRARHHIQSGPNIGNLWEAFKTIVGGNDPRNPNLITGTAPNVGIRNPESILNAVKIGETLIPKGFSFLRQQVLRTKDGTRTVNLVKDNATGKVKILEDLQKATTGSVPKVNLKNYHGEKLTGMEDGFDEWALKLTPETDHFANLSHGLNNEKLLPIMNREFEALPNGSRVDLGEIFSSDSSSNLLQYVRRNNKRIKMVLPKNADEVVVSNNYGTRGAESANIFNEQLDKLLDLYGYSPNAVPRAVYNSSTNTLTVPKLSFIKLFKKGNKIHNNSLLKRKIWN